MCVCARFLTMFLVLFCSAAPPLQSEFAIEWIVQPTPEDAAFFAGSAGEEEEDYYSLKPETEEYL